MATKRLTEVKKPEVKPKDSRFDDLERVNKRARKLFRQQEPSRLRGH